MARPGGVAFRPIPGGGAPGGNPLELPFFIPGGGPPGPFFMPGGAGREGREGGGAPGGMPGGPFFADFGGCGGAPTGSLPGGGLGLPGGGGDLLPGGGGGWSDGGVARAAATVAATVAAATVAAVMVAVVVPVMSGCWDRVMSEEGEREEVGMTLARSKRANRSTFNGAIMPTGKRSNHANVNTFHYTHHHLFARSSHLGARCHLLHHFLRRLPWPRDPLRGGLRSTRRRGRFSPSRLRRWRR